MLLKLLFAEKNRFLRSFFLKIYIWPYNIRANFSNWGQAFLRRFQVGRIYLKFPLVLTSSQISIITYHFLLLRI